VIARLPEPEPPKSKERVIAMNSQHVVAESRSCPACNTTMDRKRATGGSRSGELFWVCSAFPVCRQVIPIDEIGMGAALERTSAA